MKRVVIVMLLALVASEVQAQVRIQIQGQVPGQPPIQIQALPFQVPGVQAVAAPETQSAAQVPSVRCQQIFADGGEVKIDLEVTVPGKVAPKEFTVKVPVAQADGTITHVEQKQTRMVPVTEKKRVETKGLFDFTDLDGNVLSPEELAKRIPEEGLAVVLSSTDLVPELVRAVLKSDTVVMRRAKPADADPSR
ncbi:MAG: hypothetical protein KDB14_03745 [Planctomycetales bacterium]|nr:hypothetical protein [Planctomycetales bacterium]